MPIDVVWLHRGALLVPYEGDGDPVIETEALADLVFPRVRFRKQIKYAVMFWGIAPEAEPREGPPPEEPPAPEANLPDEGGLGVDDEDLPPATRTAAPQASQHGDIKFHGLTKDQAPLSLRRAYARLHINFGHPSKK